MNKKHTSSKAQEISAAEHKGATALQKVYRGHQSRQIHRNKIASEYGFASKTALFCIPGKSPVRILAQRVMRSTVFRNVVLLAIITNCIMMALADFRVDCMSADYELLTTDSCPRNQILIVSEPFFLGVFMLEMIVKFVAMGLWDTPTLVNIVKLGWSRAWAEADKTGYFNSGWNNLDFVIVMSSVVDVLIPASDINFSFLRSVRALRPLRTLQSMPALRHLISMLLNSVISVTYTLVFLMVIFVVWAILAVQMWGWVGRTHGRCRLTPFPVTLGGGEFTWPIDDAALANAYYDDASSVTRCTSWNVTEPWDIPQPCAWPIATESIDRLCGLPSDQLPASAVIVAGFRECPSRSGPVGAAQWCGSNYDTQGQPRFTDPKVMAADLFTADTNWGFNRYDNIFVSCLTIFQALTLGGWRAIVWQISDCFSPMLATLYWASLMVVGTFFLVKLVLAVMVKTYSEHHENHETEQQRAQAEAVFVIVEEMQSGSSTNSGYVTMGQLRKIEKQLTETRRQRRAEMHKLGSFVDKQVGTAVHTVHYTHTGTHTLFPTHYRLAPQCTR
jgi:hypothetical protein